MRQGDDKRTIASKKKSSEIEREDGEANLHLNEAASADWSSEKRVNKPKGTQAERLQQQQQVCVCVPEEGRKGIRGEVNRKAQRHSSTKLSSTSPPILWTAEMTLRCCKGCFKSTTTIAVNGNCANYHWDTGWHLSQHWRMTGIEKTQHQCCCNRHNHRPAPPPQHTAVTESERVKGERVQCLAEKQMQ